MKLQLLTAVIFLFCGSIAAQNTPDKIVSINLTSPAAISPGEETALEFTVKIKKGWHINSDKPLDKNLVPSSLVLKNNPSFNLFEVVYPEPVITILSFSEKELALFEDAVVIKVKGKIDRDLKPGKIKLEGEFTYQPCNDDTCLFPYTKTFSFEMPVKK